MQSCAYAYIIFYAHAWVCVVPKTIHTSPPQKRFFLRPPRPTPPPPTSLEIPVELHTFSKYMYLGL